MQKSPTRIRVEPKKEGAPGFLDLKRVDLGDNYESDLSFIFDNVTLRLDEGSFENISRKLGMSGTSAGEYLEDFEIFFSALTDKYGQPTEKYKNYKNGIVKAIPDRVALAAGWLVLANAWQTPRTLIIQTLRKHDIGYSHDIRYIDMRAISRKAEQTKKSNEFVEGLDPSPKKGPDTSIKKDL